MTYLYFNSVRCEKSKKPPLTLQREIYKLDISCGLYGNQQNLEMIETLQKKKKGSLIPPPHMPILGFSNSAENKDMMSKIWTKQ